MRRTIAERRTVGDLAPAWCTIQPDRGDQFSNSFENFGQWFGRIDTFKDASATLLHIGKRPDFAANLVLEVPSASTEDEHNGQQQSC